MAIGALTPEQEDFVAVVRDLGARECGTREQRDALTENGPEPPSPGLYAEVAELGWFGVAIPEDYGGAGGGMIALSRASNFPAGVARSSSIGTGSGRTSACAAISRPRARK